MTRTTGSEGMQHLGCRAYGTLVGNPVVLVSTGIGPVAAAICLAEVSAHPASMCDHWLAQTNAHTLSLGDLCGMVCCLQPSVSGIIMLSLP